MKADTRNKLYHLVDNIETSLAWALFVLLTIAAVATFFRACDFRIARLIRTADGIMLLGVTLDWIRNYKLS